MRLAALLPLLALCALSVLGFLSTFEPLERGTQLTWRAAYAVLGAGAAWLLVRVLWSRRPVEHRPSGEDEDGAATRLRVWVRVADLGLVSLLLGLWPFAWILRDGLGPEAVESHGLEAARAFRAFHAGPLTLALAAVSVALRWRLATTSRGRCRPRR